MANDEWQTPQDLFNKLNKEFGFTTDVACKPENCLCSEGIYEDSTDQNWYEYINAFWMNPPYSRGNIDKFCKKAYEESQKGCIVVGLIKLDTSTKWFHEYVMKAHEIRFCKRRVRFIDPDTGKEGGSPPFASVIVVWKPGEVDSPKVSAFDW